MNSVTCGGLGLCLIFLGVEEQTVSNKHARVVYEGNLGKEATAIAKTVDYTHRVAIEQFAFDLPDLIHVTVHVEPDGGQRLFNDGKDRLYLTVNSPESFARPSKSGTFHLYGICHEIGHMAMYRPIANHDWLTSDAAEGWAHYIGSRFVDAVYEKAGEKLWCDPYDYRADGTARLKKQLAADKPSGVTKAAGQWQAFGELTSDKGMAKVFAAWGKAKVDPTDPGKALKPALLGAVEEKKRAAAEKWWTEVEPQFVIKQKKSGFAARTIKPKELSGHLKELAHDDGTMSGKKSMAGGGHGVRFESPGSDWYLTEVKLHGSRYGTPAAPKEDFSVWLCDEKMNVIAVFKQPYAKFERGEPAWVALKVRPTRVPAKFTVCVGFNPTGTKGVFVSRDAESSGNSLSGLPGKASAKFEDGDWLIRAVLDRPKAAEALGGE